MITRNGIYYDFYMSSYRLKINNITFIFSSELHLLKFKARYEENRETINSMLSKRFRFFVENNTLADISLYMKIESRGFLIMNEKGEYICKEKVTLNGERLTMKQ